MMNCRFLFHSISFSGAGIKAAYAVAREEANGRRAHQIWSVEIWPCRMFFSRADSSLTSFTGELTSMNRFIELNNLIRCLSASLCSVKIGVETDDLQVVFLSHRILIRIIKVKVKTIGNLKHYISVY